MPGWRWACWCLRRARARSMIDASAALACIAAVVGGGAGQEGRVWPPAAGRSQSTAGARPNSVLPRPDRLLAQPNSLLHPANPSIRARSGDSGGIVQFWDGRFGTLLAGFSQHQADVLQLAASADGNMVFAAGACCFVGCEERVCCRCVLLVGVWGAPTCIAGGGGQWAAAGGACARQRLPRPIPLL